MLNIKIYLLLCLAAYAACAGSSERNKKGPLRRFVCYCCVNDDTVNTTGKRKYRGGGDIHFLSQNENEKHENDNDEDEDNPTSDPPIVYYKCIPYKGLNNMDNNRYIDGSPNICIYEDGVMINDIQIPMDIGNKNVRPVVQYNEIDGFTVNGRKVPADAKGNPLKPANE